MFGNARGPPEKRKKGKKDSVRALFHVKALDLLHRPGWGRTPTPSPMIRPCGSPLLQAASRGRNYKQFGKLRCYLPTVAVLLYQLYGLYKSYAIEHMSLHGVKQGVGPLSGATQPVFFPECRLYLDPGSQGRPLQDASLQIAWKWKMLQQTHGNPARS